MNSNKPPVLTSPWKIGFFVSLMLVFVSIGVTYFFMDKAGVSWNWQDKNEWLGVLKGEGFLADILPLIALVALSSLIAYLVISNGVRKYKRYLESGLDYKNLLVSLKDIDDIQDKTKIEKIRHQPELKRLLLNISESVSTRMKDLDARGNELEKQADEELRAREEELTSEITEQCEELTRAIENATAGQFSEELEISHPSLKRVEHAVRSAMASTAPKDGAFEFSGGDQTDDSSYDELRRASDVLNRRLREIVGEMKQSSDTAKEIESQLVEVSPSGADLSESDQSDGGKSSGTLSNMLKTIESLSTTLGALSEETKGIAISTALSAGSGEGTQDDLIRLAEEVKDVSSRFKASSTQYTELTAELKTTIGELEAAYGGDVKGSDPRSLGHAISAIQSKVALWVERIVVLSDKMTNFQESYSLAIGSSPEADAADAPPMAEASQKPDDANEFSFESLDGSRTVFSDSDNAPAVPSTNEPHDRGMFGAITPDERSLTDSDGQKLSEEEEKEPMAAPDTDFADRREEAVEATATPAEDLVEEPADLHEEPVDEPDATEQPAAPAAMEGFETFSRPQPSSRPEPVGADIPAVDVERTESFKPKAPADRPDTRGAVVSEDENVVDLYALGAVDYDPAVHG